MKETVTRSGKPGKMGMFDTLIVKKVLSLIKVFLAFLVWNPGDSYERINGHKDLYPEKDDKRRCKTIRPYKKCELIPMELTEAFFDLPIGSLVELGCFPSDDMSSVCSDFGICDRTKRYAIRRGGPD
jgi:hypothetical protein